METLSDLTDSVSYGWDLISLFSEYPMKTLVNSVQSVGDYNLSNSCPFLVP